MRAQLELTLKNAGLSITLPRLCVFNYLLGHGPVTIAEIIVHCISQADRASIYRSIEVFRRLGIVTDLVIGGRKVIELSEEYSTHHHHLSCTNCGRSVDITDKSIEKRLNSLAEGYGFLPTAHQVEVSGLCQACR